jgi:hypothetical protein
MTVRPTRVPRRLGGVKAHRAFFLVATLDVAYRAEVRIGAGVGLVFLVCLFDQLFFRGSCLAGWRGLDRRRDVACQLFVFGPISLRPGLA